MFCGFPYLLVFAFKLIKYLINHRIENHWQNQSPTRKNTKLKRTKNSRCSLRRTVVYMLSTALLCLKQKKIRFLSMPPVLRGTDMTHIIWINIFFYFPFIIVRIWFLSRLVVWWKSWDRFYTLWIIQNHLISLSTNAHVTKPQDMRLAYFYEKTKRQTTQMYKNKKNTSLHSTSSSPRGYDEKQEWSWSKINQLQRKF